MQLHESVVLSELECTTHHYFSKKDVVDLGEVQKDIEYSHNAEAFLRKQNIETFMWENDG